MLHATVNADTLGPGYFTSGKPIHFFGTNTLLLLNVPVQLRYDNLLLFADETRERFTVARYFRLAKVMKTMRSILLLSDLQIRFVDPNPYLKVYMAGHCS